MSLKSAVRRSTSFLSELKERRVIRVAAAYLIIAFGALQVADIVAPALRLPDWTVTLVLVLVAAGFVLAVVLSWAFDIVPAGDRPSASGSVSIAKPDTLASTPVQSTPRVAVIPFLNLSPDPANEYFADGMTEDVIASLSKISALRVISRTSVMPFKQRGQSLQAIAAALGATTIVDGSIRRDGDRVRIVAELVDVSTDRHLWAETYDRRLTDIFAIQSDVAFRIATALRAQLSVDEQTRIRREPTTSIPAYELYLQGRQHFTRFTPTSMRRALEYYQRALQIDPAFALAYANIALAYTELCDGGHVPAESARPRAEEATSAALRLDPSLSEAYTAAGYIKSLWSFDWEGAESAFRKAIELSPSNADAYDFYGRMCSARGQFDQAVELVRRAQELDPLTHRTDVANTLLRAGRYHEAEGEALRSVAMEPGHDRARATLGWAYIKQNKSKEGLAELEQAVALSPDSTQWPAQLAQARAMSGDEAGARSILKQLEERAARGYVSPYHLAFIYTGLGEADRAIDLLERALDEGSGSIHGIRGSFLFASLRDHPRFQSLVQRINA
jgi:adenylate cyclase